MNNMMISPRLDRSPLLSPIRTPARREVKINYSRVCGEVEAGTGSVVETPRPSTSPWEVNSKPVWEYDYFCHGSNFSSFFDPVVMEIITGLWCDET